MLVILLIGVARFEKGRTCKQQFKTVDLYWAEPVATGWFPVSTVARFTSIPNYLESVPPGNFARTFRFLLLFKYFSLRDVFKFSREKR